MKITNYSIMELDEKIAAKENAISDLDIAISKKQDDVIRLSEEVLVLSKQLKDSYESIPVVQSDIEKLKVTLKDIQAQLDVANATREDFVRQNASYARSIEEAKRELKETKELTLALPKMRAEYAEAKQQTQILKASLIEAKILVVQEETKAARIKDECAVILMEAKEVIEQLAKEKDMLAASKHELEIRKKALDMRESSMSPNAENNIPLTLRRHLEGKIKDLALKITIDKLLSGYKT
jgi:chromosome segregation ATPase